MIQIIGWLATVFSLSYKIPQIIKLYKSQETSGLSLKSLYIQECSYVFLITHSISREDYPIIMMGIFSLLQSTIILILYHKFQNKIKDPTTV